MSSYATDHAEALADVAEDGAAISFTLATDTVDESTGVHSSPATATVAGQAIESDEAFEEFRSMGLTHTKSIALFFVPTTIGTMPTAGYGATWGGENVTVERVKPFAPNGTAIMASVLVTR